MTIDGNEIIEFGELFSIITPKITERTFGKNSFLYDFTCSIDLNFRKLLKFKYLLYVKFSNTPCKYI